MDPAFIFLGGFAYNKSNKTKDEKKGLRGIPDGSHIKMYTAVQNGQPIQFVDKVKSLFGIKLTDQYFGDEYLISWTVSNGVAVADKPLLVHRDI